MRYETQKNFKEIGDKGQKALEGKSVALVGLGNIGSTIAVMLNRAGINLRLVDKGRVELPELAGQAMYLEEDHSKFKAKQAKKYLEEINPRVKVRTFHEDLTKNNIYLIDADVVIDAAGNLETSELIANQAKKNKTPLIYVAASGSQGVIATGDKGLKIDKVITTVNKMKTVEEAGIVNPAVHMAAALVVSKTMKILLNKKYNKDLIQFDAWTESIKKSKL